MSTINERIRLLRDAKGLSQEAFASGAHRTRSEIKNIEYGKTLPKEEVIQSICAAYNVNDTWLRTGAGDMFRPVSRDEEITTFMNAIMREESDDFRRRLISVLCRLDTSEWELLEKMALKLAEEHRQEQGSLHVVHAVAANGQREEVQPISDEVEEALQPSDFEDV